MCNTLHTDHKLAYPHQMTLPHAILVSLSERSGSGYELTRRFDGSIAHFWAATHQQIYKTLQTMADNGWVSVTAVVQQTRPDKKVYTVSDAGRAELTRWLAAPLTGSGSAVTDPRTRELAVKLRGAGHGGADAVSAVRDQVVAQRAERAALLDTFQGFQKTHFPEPAGLTGNALHQYLVLRGGIHAERAALDWLDEILTALGDPA
jgi:DNA-binding PadR family transcriptional regulator